MDFRNLILSMGLNLNLIFNMDLNLNLLFNFYFIQFENLINFTDLFIFIDTL